MNKSRLPNLTKKNLIRARRVLFEVTELLDNENIIYHLEGGTLLGIVRDNDLLPWDHDVDISILNQSISKVFSIKDKLRKKGYRISIRKSQIESGPIKVGDYSIIKIKPIIPYYINWILPKFGRRYVVLDIFIKTNYNNHTYWQAQGKLMRVENKYYESFETIVYKEHVLKTPNYFRDYLTQKYGDWSIPIKEWECGRDEKTVVDK